MGFSAESPLKYIVLYMITKKKASEKHFIFYLNDDIFTYGTKNEPRDKWTQIE